jgi:diguanylate cyclase (GGDEF)-like protein
MAIFAVVALLLPALRDALRNAQELSRHDAVTAAENSRHFRELLAGEIARTERSGRPFTLAYFDLDNFKAVNDSLGHAVGDQLLKQCVSTLLRHLRRTDVTGRLGGDEFACLFPDTDQAGAATVLERLHQSLQEEMRTARWPVTFSIGAVTFVGLPRDSDEALHMADELMYGVKRSGKGGLRHETFIGAGAEPR